MEDKNKAPAWFSLFSDFDIALFRSGKHYRLYDKLGAHAVEHLGERGERDVGGLRVVQKLALAQPRGAPKMVVVGVAEDAVPAR